MSVLTKIIKIGNSQGIRIPKTLLEQIDFGEEVELLVQAGQLLVRPVSKPRANWSIAFQKMAEAQEDYLLDEQSASDWDNEEWEW